MKHILKKSAVLAILSIMLLSLIVPVFAHPGSLDANGGHYNKKTGEYHYHHGYPAHQHTNGKCPYDFHDNVDDDYTPNKNSSSSSSSSYTPTEPTTKNQNKKSEKVSIFAVIKNWFSRNSTNISCFWMFCIFAPLGAIYLFYEVIKKAQPLWLNISCGVSSIITIIFYFLSL